MSNKQINPNKQKLYRSIGLYEIPDKLDNVIKYFSDIRNNIEPEYRNSAHIDFDDEYNYGSSEPTKVLNVWYTVPKAEYEIASEEEKIKAHERARIIALEQELENLKKKNKISS